MSLTKEQKSLALKWADELESGAYVQGTGRLLASSADGDSFCCWGVLCDMLSDGEAAYFNSDQWHGLGSTCYATPPTAVVDLVGMTQFHARILACDNDCGYSFRQIARRIRRFANGGEL